jgi:hypothetical protein
VETGAAQIAVHKQRLLTPVGIGDGKMGRDRRLPLAGSGTGDTIERNRPSKSDSRMVLRIVRTDSSKSEVER